MPPSGRRDGHRRGRRAAVPSFKGLMATKSKSVEEVTVADLALDPSQVGSAGCPPAGRLGPSRRGRKAGEVVVDGVTLIERVIGFLEQLKSPVGG